MNWSFIAMVVSLTSVVWVWIMKWAYNYGKETGRLLGENNAYKRNGSHTIRWRFDPKDDVLYDDRDHTGKIIHSRR